MTEQQELFWNLLQANPSWAAHHIGHKLSTLKGKKFHRQLDQQLEYVMNVFDSINAIRIVATWLNVYKLPMDPSELECFDRFHITYGKEIINSCYHGGPGIECF